VLLGGVLTEALGWEWIFFVNVPVTAAAIAVAPLLLAESQARSARAFDLAGAVLVTAGLVVLAYAITEAPSHGWASPETIARFAAAIALLALFAAVELRIEDPLLPLSIFRTQTVTGANVAGFILQAALFAQFLMTTLYMQQVLGYSPLKTGIAFVAVAGTAVVWSTVSAQLVGRMGVKRVLAVGMTALVAGNVYLAHVSVGGSYVTDLLPGFLVVGLGVGFSFVPISIAALAGVREAQAGVASGLINTSWQIGGALGIATLSTLAATTTGDALEGGTPQATALTEGFQAALWGSAAAAAIGLVAALALIRPRDLEQAGDEHSLAEAA
jgi:MFS family permease